jgi:hypothetical protein
VSVQGFNSIHYNIFRRPWGIRDLLDSIRFPRRRSLLPAIWVDELMQKRFGTLLVCSTCEVKYREGLNRWAYAPHANMRGTQDTGCDFCHKDVNMRMWHKEEHRYRTADEIARAVWHSATRQFQDTRRVPFAHRLPIIPRRREPLKPGALVSFAGHRIQ